MLNGGEIKKAKGINTYFVKNICWHFKGICC